MEIQSKMWSKMRPQKKRSSNLSNMHNFSCHILGKTLKKKKHTRTKINKQTKNPKPLIKICSYFQSSGDGLHFEVTSSLY